MNRVLTAARLQLVHPLVILGVPWLIGGISFAINYAIWGLAGIGDEPGAFTGGLASLYITLLVVYVQALTQLLPFAMGVSITRRSYYLGMILVAVVESLGCALALTALAAIERATGGWGIGLAFWAPGGLADLDPTLRILAYAGPLLACACLGMAIGVVQKRWGPTGLWTLSIGTLVVVGAATTLITWGGAWSPIGTWLADRSLLTLTAGIPALLALTAAGLTWTALRRLVP